MATLRKTYRITPDEEDVIVKKVDDAMAGIFEIFHKERVENAIDDLLNTMADPGDTIRVSYAIDLSVNMLIAWLKEMRKTQHARKR